MEIIADTLSEAHEAAIDAILSRHKEIYIQTHVDKKEFTLEFEDAEGNPDEIKIKVRHPFAEPQLSLGSAFSKRPQFTREYKKQFLTLSPHREDGNHAVYTYWNRLEDHPFSIYDRSTGKTMWGGDGNGNGFKQITELVTKLAADPNSRRGVMITWNPILDARSTEPPCMNWLQVVIRNGKAHLRVLFRSQDMLLGLPENLVGGSALFEYIVEELNKAGLKCTAGIFTLISTIPHIYKKRDSDDLDNMKVEINRKKVFGLWKVQMSEL